MFPFLFDDIAIVYDGGFGLLPIKGVACDGGDILAEPDVLGGRGVPPGGIGAPGVVAFAC